MCRYNAFTYTKHLPEHFHTGMIDSTALQTLRCMWVFMLAHVYVLGGFQQPHASHSCLMFKAICFFTHRCCAVRHAERTLRRTLLIWANIYIGRLTGITFWGHMNKPLHLMQDIWLAPRLEPGLIINICACALRDGKYSLYVHILGRYLRWRLCCSAVCR